VKRPAQASSYEVRWIRLGPLDAAMARWFKRVPVRTEAREDAYLVEPQLEGLSVKIRGDETLDVKARVERLGEVVLAPSARGHLESWKKCSFPFGPDSDRAIHSAMWKRVRKVRTMAWRRDDRWLTERPPEGSPDPTCAIELTEIAVGDEHWWTLGFESTGPPDGRRGTLDAAAAIMFGESLPDGLVLGPDDSGPYSEWLRR